MQVLHLETDDGARLRSTHWPLAGGTPALILPGRGEPSDKYAEVAAELQQRGFDVWGLNWRGQGGSSATTHRPQRGYIRTFDLYSRDFSAFLRYLSAHQGIHRPTVFGHSMGAHLALRLAHDQPDALGDLILSAPMVAVALPAPSRLIRLATDLAISLGQGARFVPGSAPPAARRFDGNDLTSDRARFERYLALLDAQPNLVTGGATIAWLRAALRAAAHLQSPGFAERIHNRSLLLAPADDTLVPPETIENFAARMPHADFIRLPAARHELFQEIDATRAALWRQVDGFLLRGCQP